MNKQTERARIRAAKPAPSRAFVAGVAYTLDHLPRQKVTIAPNRRLAMTAAWAAGILLLLAFAGPPVARAASQLWHTLFADKAQEIRQEQALPEEQRVELHRTEREKITRSHPIEAQGKAGGITVVLGSFSMNDSDPTYSAHSLRGEISVGMRFPDAPADFDPAKLDFSLESGDKTIPMIMDDAITYYRETGNKANDGGGDWANVYFAEGIMRCQVAFPYDAWDTEQKTDFALTTKIGNETLRIPFTYDPALAHEAALVEEQADLQRQDQYDEQQARTMEQLAAAAVPIGVTVTVDKAQVTLEEMAIVDGEVHFSMLLKKDGVHKAKLAGMEYGIDNFRVDGLQSTGCISDAQRRDDGSLAMQLSIRLNRDPRKLPKESLIFLEVEHLGDDVVTLPNGVAYLERTLVPIVYRYDWRMKVVRLPTDETEKAAWITESKELSKRWPDDKDLEKGIYRDLYWEPDQAITQTIQGVTLTLQRVRFHPDVEVEFRTNLTKEPQYLEKSASATFDGMPAEAMRGGYGPEFLSVSMLQQFHPGEMTAPVPVTLDIPMKEIGGKSFHFEWTIDPAKIQVEEH